MAGCLLAVGGCPLAVEEAVGCGGMSVAIGGECPPAEGAVRRL